MTKKIELPTPVIHPTPGLTMIGLFAIQTDFSVLVSDKVSQ
jgi:hypothetical protein